MSRLTDALDQIKAPALDAPPPIRVGGDATWDTHLMAGVRAEALRLNDLEPTEYLAQGAPSTTAENAIFYRGHECIIPKQRIGRTLALIEEFALVDLPEEKVQSIVSSAKHIGFAYDDCDIEAALSDIERTANACDELGWSEHMGGAAVLDRRGGGAVWCVHHDDMPLLIRSAGTVVFAASTCHPIETLVRFIDLKHTHPGWAARV